MDGLHGPGSDSVAAGRGSDRPSTSGVLIDKVIAMPDQWVMEVGIRKRAVADELRRYGMYQHGSMGAEDELALHRDLAILPICEQHTVLYLYKYQRRSA